METIRQKVTTALLAKRVLKTYKTKRGTGRKSVTVGPYHRATDRGHVYAVIIGGDATPYEYAQQAAEAFVDYVGTKLAREALGK